MVALDKKDSCVELVSRDYVFEWPEFESVIILKYLPWNRVNIYDDARGVPWNASQVATEGLKLLNKGASFARLGKNRRFAPTCAAFTIREADGLCENICTWNLRLLMMNTDVWIA